MNEDYNFSNLAKTNITTNNINILIDSSQRIKEDKYINENEVKLNNNCFSLKKDNNLLTIKCTNHNLNIGDKININNLDNISFLNSFIGNSVARNDVIFTNNTNYIKINFNFNKKYNIENLVIDKYEEQYINILNITCDNNILGNLDLNLLLGVHRIYFNINQFETNLLGEHQSNNYYFFYIKLPLYFNSGNKSIEIINQINLKLELKLLNIAGVHIDKIKTGLDPIINLDKYKIVNDIINHDTFNIKLINKSPLEFNFGNNIYISKIKKNIIGYPNPNNYNIKLDQTLNNIKSINILSSIIPHIKNNINNSNNKLCIDFFNMNYKKKIILDDGCYRNIIEVGNAIKKKIDVIHFNNSNKKQKYYYKNLDSNININLNSNLIEIKIYNTIILNNAIYVDKSNNNLKIHHPLHNLNVNDKIIISNAKSTNNIDSNFLNGEFSIYKILDNFNYLVKLKNIIINSDNEITNGGDNIQIKYLIKFSLDFSIKNSIGDILGFKNIGSKYSKTIYDYTISNKTPYLNNILKIDNSPIKFKLKVIDYLIIYCNLNYNFEDDDTININNNSFIPLAKIHLNNINNYVNNNHVNLIGKLDNIIPNINEINFKFIDSENNLYDFGDLDHSLVINFVCEKLENFDTNLNTNTGLSSAYSSLQKVSIIR